MGVQTVDGGCTLCFRGAGPYCIFRFDDWWKQIMMFSALGRCPECRKVGRV